ncbi:MAG: hydrolase [Casimicrobiaceae bacterium]
MLIDAERSMLLAIDLQEKMLPAIADHAEVASNCAWLLRAATRIGVPVAGIEQNPRGLGPLVPEIRALLPERAVATKTHFSSVAARALRDLPGADRAQIVIIGVEAHVCVLQSALDLYHEGKEVYCVADCVGSRRQLDRDVALARMRQAGVRIVSREMVVFEWLADAATPLFKAVSREFLK